MDFLTTNTGKKRQMIFLPQVNPNTFLFLFEKGSTGYSWSLRDYSSAHRVSECYAREFGWSSADLRGKAKYIFDAPTVDTNQLGFWHEYTAYGNNLFLKRDRQGASESISAQLELQRQSTNVGTVQYPILNYSTFCSLPKAAKRGDVERMRFSPESEDWVTWNLLNLLKAKEPIEWWPQIVKVARAANPSLELSLTEGERPCLDFWRRVPSPTDYERANRARMRTSFDPHVAARSRDPKPVEGESEIDVVLNTPRHLVFVEAKLGSDISMRTTYDPTRNQIVRNIDCLLESASEKEPFFWMFVRDRGIGRAYCHLVGEYKRNPEKLFLELPHRDPELLRKIARNVAILTWQELAATLLEIQEFDSTEVCALKRELKRRISAD